MVTIGAIVAILNSNKSNRWLPILLQCLLTAVVLMTGARQYALVGALVFAVIAAKGGLRVRPIFVVCGGLLVLVLITLVSARRNAGMLSSTGSADNLPLTAALSEMGGTLETASLVIGWIDESDSLVWGGGYWLPIERGLGLIIPDLRKDLETDPRALSEVLASRTSGLGGSAVAESFYNFGFAGVVVFAAFGCALAYMGSKARTPTSLTLEGVLLYALTHEVRNWFLSVPAMIALGAIPILLAFCFRGGRDDALLRRLQLQEKATTSAD